MQQLPQNFFVFPESRRWQAKWIWYPGQPRVNNSFYLFRKEFELDAGTEKATAYIAADTRYQLYINGTFVGRGAPQSQPFFQYYDERDVMPFLVQGSNVIGVIVNYVGNLPDTRGGLLVEVVDVNHDPLVISNETWLAQRAQAWQDNTFYFRMNQATPYQEVFDARAMPEAWDMSCSLDDSWRRTEVIHGRFSDTPPTVTPWSRLVPRDIPDMTEAPVLPVAVAYCEECLDIANRMRGEDLSTALSAPGQPVRYSRISGADSLTQTDGLAVLQCSADHLDHIFDGIYDPCIVLDFGRVISGYANIELDGIEGAILDIGYAERLLDGHFNNALEGQFADRYIMRKGMQTYQPFTWKAFRYLKLRLRSCSEHPVTLLSVKAITSTYPYEERGLFASSDDVLNKVWDISRYTVRLCSNEFLMDTPWREQAQWLGDVAAVTLGAIYSCFGDPRLPAKFLRQSGANQHPTGLISNVSNSVNHAWQGAIPDYSLWWIMSLWNHYMFTGETRWLDELYPVAVQVIQAHMHYLNPYGLLEDMPYWVFIDWADTDRRGECTANNAIFYGALQALASMAAFKHDTYMQQRVETVMQVMKSNFQTRLYDTGRGCFADARVGNELSAKVSEHANLAAILWGLCDDDVGQGIITRLYEQRSIAYTEAQPFFTTVVVQALDRVGRFDLAMSIIRERWGERMVAKGATSTYEEWGINGSWRSGEYAGFLRTLSHAWSAHPAEFLIRNMVGAEILEPGCAKLKLTPKVTPFDYHVILPTPNGDVSIHCKQGQVVIDAPDSISIE